MCLLVGSHVQRGIADEQWTWPFGKKHRKNMCQPTAGPQTHILVQYGAHQRVRVHMALHDRGNVA